MHVLILAGGQGTRLWPLSRKQRPKQLQLLFSDRSLLQETVARAATLTAAENIFVLVSNDFQLAEVKRQLPELPSQNIMREPAARNTAAAIAYGTSRMQQLGVGENDTIAVFSSDHVIRNPKVLHHVLLTGAAFLETHPEYLLTVGITPTYPETGYGYVACGQPLTESVSAVAAFREKPDAETAARYCADGQHLWNAGIFLWHTDTIRKQLRAAHPAYEAIVAATDETALAQAYEEAPNQSIDYAVLEKADKLAVIPAKLEWLDIGHWQAVRDAHQPRTGDNVTTGRHVGVATTNCLILNKTERLVGTAGIDGLIIVDTPDALLVCRATDAQAVKQLVAEIEAHETEPPT